MITTNFPSLVEPLAWPELTAKDIGADILRLDKLHPVVSGNKWFKLKGYLQEVSGIPILTFGGAWSNHLIATAYAARQAGLSSIGIVRGERPPVLSSTLDAATAFGMHLEFISRKEYAEKEQPDFLRRLAHRYPGAYIIPEGGAGITGIRGSEDILRSIDAEKYTHILCAIGTGTTWLGLARASFPGQAIIGIPVLKGMDDTGAIERSALLYSALAHAAPDALLTPDQRRRCRLLTGYHFGGYARHPQALLNFMNNFYHETGVPSDIVYTGKLFYAVQDAVVRNLFPAHSRLLLVHSGGLQGNRSLAPGILDF
jgi:1-aminocyclopropane-1-carboxylate deaminase